MRYLPAIAIFSLSLGALPAWSEAQENVAFTRNDQDDLRQQIEQNWNINSDSAEACGVPVDLRILLASDGSGEVTEVEILPGMPDTIACKAIAQSARRAVLMSSPLRLPADNGLTSIKLHFNPDFLKN